MPQAVFEKLLNELEKYGFEYDYNTSLGLIRVKGNVRYIYDYDYTQYDFCQEKRLSAGLFQHVIHDFGKTCHEL